MKNEKKEGMISIIVPVYNTAEYVSRCIESVLQQTYSEWELILVDDGSTDQSSEICKEYAAKDQRIIYIRKENGGAGSARNKGLDAASGEFIGFADSDDYIRADMYETLYNMIKDTGADISICGVYTDENERNDTHSVRVMDNKTVLNELLNEKILSYPINKLYRRELFNNVYFPTDMTFEDLYVMPEIFKNADKVAITKKEFYYYYLTREGNVSSNKSAKHAADCSKAFMHRFYFAKENGIENMDKIELKAVSSTIGAYGLTSYEKDGFEEYRICAKRFFNNNLKTIMHNKSLGIGRKLAAAIIAKSDLYDCLYRIIKARGEG